VNGLRVATLGHKAFTLISRANSTMMSNTIRWIVAALCLSNASSFGIPDSFHLMHHAASSSLGHMDLLGAYKHALTEFPLPTKMATGASLAVAGDAIAQSQDPSTEYDKRRASSFAVFDMAYRALQHYSFPVIVQHCHGQFLGAALASLPFLHDNAAAVEQTLASQLGIVPFLYYPAFFSLTGVVQGLSFSQGLTRAKENFLPLMQRNLLFWIPVQFVQFGFIQEDLQIPFLSACGLAWTFILSVSAGSTKNYSPEDELSHQLEGMMSFHEDEELMADAYALSSLSNSTATVQMDYAIKR